MFIIFIHVARDLPVVKKAGGETLTNAMVPAWAI